MSADTLEVMLDLVGDCSPNPELAETYQTDY